MDGCRFINEQLAPNLRMRGRYAWHTSNGYVDLNSRDSVDSTVLNSVY